MAVAVMRHVSSSSVAGHFYVHSAIYKHNGYERGTKWSISEYELDRALAVYRKRNPEVKARLKKGAFYMEAKDVNAIVELATYGLLKLELSEFPLYKQR